MAFVLRTGAFLIFTDIISGLGAYSYSFKRQQFEKCVLATLYTLFVIALFSTIYLRDIYSDISSGSFDLSNVSKLYTYMNIIASIVCFITHLYYARHHVRLINLCKQRLTELMDFFNDGEMYKQQARRTITKRMFIPILLHATLVARALHYEPDRNLLWTMYTLLPYLVRTGPATNLYGVLLLTTAFLKSINCRIRSIADEVSHIHTHKEWLLKTRYQRMRRYCELSDAIDVLNEKYTKTMAMSEEFLKVSSLTWLSSILCNVVGIMLGFFTQYKAIADTLFSGKAFDVYNVVTDSVYMFISFMEIYTQSEASSDLLDEARRTGVVLQTADTTDADIKLRQGMDFLSLRILQKDFKIKPLGLFEINMSLIHKVFATATGFLLILIQSDLSKRFLQ